MENTYTVMVSRWRYWYPSSIFGIQPWKKGVPKTHGNIWIPMHKPSLEDMTHYSHRHGKGMHWSIISPVCLFIMFSLLLFNLWLYQLLLYWHPVLYRGLFHLIARNCETLYNIIFLVPPARACWFICQFIIQRVFSNK